MSVSFDSNTFYALMSVASDSYLGYNFLESEQATIITSSSEYTWQFADTGTEAYYIRSNQDASLCLTYTSQLSLIPCDPQHNIEWTTSQYSDDNGNQGIVISNSGAGEIEVDPDLTQATATVNVAPSFPSGDTSVINFLWGTTSVSAVDNDIYSTVPFLTSSADGPDSTASTTSLNGVPFTLGDPFPTPVATYITPEATITTPEATFSTPEATYMTPSFEYSPALTKASGAATQTAGSGQITSSAGLPNQPAANFYLSEVGRSFNDINPIAAALILPQKTNVICTNCTASGYFNSVVIGSDSVYDFFEDGYVELDFAGLQVNTTLDVQLMPGFTPVNCRLSLYNKTIGSTTIGDDISLDFVFEIGIPIQIVVETPVNFQAGFVYSLPSSASIIVDPADPTNSSAAGWDASTVEVLPFSYNAPGLTLSLLTGLQPRVYLSASAAAGSDASVTGTVEIDLDIPRINITASALLNVNSDCQSPQGKEPVYHYAALLNADVEGDLHAAGSVKAEVGSFDKVWSAPELPVISIKEYAPPICVYGDRIASSISTRLTVGLRTVVMHAFILCSMVFFIF